MFRCTPPIMSDLLLGSASHVQSPVVTLVISSLEDYENAVLIGLPTYLVHYLQSVSE